VAKLKKEKNEKKRKKRSNSKGIGNNYERNFSKKLSFWLTGSDEKLVVWRNVNSGTCGTIRRKKGYKDNALSGDLQCLVADYQPFFDKFYIDTKCYKKFNSFIINNKNIKSNELFKQWVKTCEDCSENMYPIMPVKVRDGITPEFIFLPNKLCFSMEDYIKYNVTFNDRLYSFYIILLEDFFKYNDWKTLCSIN
jgi:hypothetical protein